MQYPGNGFAKAAEEAEVKNRAIETGAKAIADDQMLPGGRRKKVSRLVEDHLPWFDAAEARGMTWEDMSAALSAAGVTRPDGRPLSIGTLSSAVWRKRNQATLPERPHRAAGSPRPISVEKPPTSSRAGLSQSSSNTRSKGHVRPTPRSERVDQPRDDMAPKGAGVLAFMHRAAKMRRFDGAD